MTIVDTKPKKDSLRINLKKGAVNMEVRIFTFRDKDTRQIIYYIPSLEITGYGATKEKAMEMVDFSLDELFTFLISLSEDELKTEMNKMGWIRAKYAKKEFSKSYVDGDGNLKQFNAVADEVEQLTLVA